MKEKTKEFLKKYLIGFVLGIVSACTISVIAATYFPSNDVTYDNSESGLTSTNVQGRLMNYMEYVQLSLQLERLL